MLGTDYPFPLGELQPGMLIESMEEFDEPLKALTTFLSFQQIKLYTPALDISLILVANDDRCMG